jgi:hypothetical protein
VGALLQLLNPTKRAQRREASFPQRHARNAIALDQRVEVRAVFFVHLGLGSRPAKEPDEPGEHARRVFTAWISSFRPQRDHRIDFRGPPRGQPGGQ